MTRKKQHEKAPAADQPEAVAPDGASEQPEQEAAALVESADRGAAEAGAAEQPVAPADAGDGSGLGVDAGVQDGAGTAVAVETAREDGEPLTEAEVDAALAALPPDAGETADREPDYSADPATHNAAHASLAIVASTTDWCTHCYGEEIYGGGAADELATLVRKIGKAADGAVLAQHLRLKKFREGEPDLIELTTLEFFSLALYSSDLLRAHFRRAAEEAMREAEKRPPLPIDETTLEEVDGPFDTWSEG